MRLNFDRCVLVLSYILVDTGTFNIRPHNRNLMVEERADGAMGRFIAKFERKGPFG